jgi:predicted deacylase
MHRTVQNFPVDLGPRIVNLPVFDSGSGSTGKTFLITAGMDGDEYCGIEAALKLITLYQHQKVNGRLIIIPLVNLPGFEIGHSKNPIDGKYPKLIYPGKKAGSASERLIWFISVNYIQHADVWIDLHGGATDEMLYPCILSYQTGNVITDGFSLKLCSVLDSDAILTENNCSWRKVQKIAENNCTYLIFESGDSGKLITADVDRHIGWVNSAISAAGMTHGKIKTNPNDPKNYFQANIETCAEYDCIFYPVLTPGVNVSKDAIMGDVINLKTKSKTIIRSKYAGKLLWQKHVCPVARGETLFAVAF